MNTLTNLKIVLLVLVILLFGSCNPEKKIAVNFISKAANQNVMLIPPASLFKTNLKTYLLDSIEIGKNEDTNAVLLANSELIGDLNDSLFITNYIYGFKRSLEYYGIRVFDEDQADIFLSLDSNAYQINIAQIELEETLYTYRDEVMYYDQYYFHDLNLNAVYINSWFEYTDINSESDKQEVYFTTDMITDIAEGEFEYDIFKGKVRYMYNIDSLKQDMLYEFAFRVGVEYARYTFDMLLNEEIDKKLNSGQRSDTYWRYDPQGKLFFPAQDDRFILLK